MSLLPRFLCRVGGLPMNVLMGLRAPATEALALQLHEASTRLRRLAESVSNELYVVIGKLEGRDRTAALRLRRDLFNLRSPRPVELERVRALAPVDLARQIDTFLALMARLSELQQAFRSVYAQDKLQIRGRFRQMLADEWFQKGLLLASPTLFEQQERYAHTTEMELGPRDAKIERGLLRYFTRAAMKATPFGTFCAILPGAVVPANGADAGNKGWFAVQGDPRVSRTCVRLNKALLGLLQARLQQNPDVRRQLKVELNPSVRVEHEGQLHFMSSTAQGETIQRLARTPALGVVTDLLETVGSCSLESLAQLLQSAPGVEASPQTALMYLERLIEIGFLRYRYGIPTQEVDWDLRLRDALASVDHEEARRIFELLLALRKQAEAYESATVSERVRLTRAMQEAVAPVLRDLGILGSLEQPRVPVYEDATAAAQVILATTPDVERIEAELSRLAALSATLAAPRAEQLVMRHFFEKHYGAARTVNLLQFYEDYYRASQEEHLRNERGQRAETGTTDSGEWNPSRLEALRRQQDAQRRITAIIAHAWSADPTAEEIHIPFEELERLVSHLPKPTGPRSLSFFVQPVPPTGETPARVVLKFPGHSAGFGKLFSRFLYLEAGSIKAALRAANNGLGGGELAEIGGDANFNANLHPPLLPAEIAYPIGESSDAATCIRCFDLVVEPDPDDELALRLIDVRSGRRVIPVDLGFLNPSFRPPLYQLLSRFMPPATFTLPLPRRPSAAPEGTDENVCYRPRLVLGETLVLSRRCWLVPPAAHPRRARDGDAAAYYVRLTSWRVEHGIPSEVFVRFVALGVPGRKPVEPESETTDAEAAGPTVDSPRRGVRETGKPQYIDFTNPLLVDLFSSLTPEPGKVMQIEERYPGVEGGLRHGGQSFAMEVLLQLDFPVNAQRHHAVAHREAVYVGD